MMNFIFFTGCYRVNTWQIYDNVCTKCLVVVYVSFVLLQKETFVTNVVWGLSGIMMDYNIGFLKGNVTRKCTFLTYLFPVKCAKAFLCRYI